jgi:hypothetical protein
VTMQSLFSTRQLMASAWRRMVRARRWIALQFVGLALLIAMGLVWTRIPEKHAGQVLLSVLLPLLIAAIFLLLQGGTMRSLLRPPSDQAETESRWVSLAWGSTTLLIWIAIAWLACASVDRYDNHIVGWASYLNSRFGETARARIATYPHIFLFLTWIGTALRWVIVPGFLIPIGCSAAWGLRRLLYRRVAHVWLNWRWWPGVLFAALIGEVWPRTWFDANPHGSVHEQVRRVVIKLVAVYLIAVISWVFTMVWAATLLTKQDAELKPAPLSPSDTHSDVIELPLRDSGESPGGNA